MRCIPPTWQSCSLLILIQKNLSHEDVKKVFVLIAFASYCSTSLANREMLTYPDDRY